MKSVLKLIRRFVGIMFISFILIFILNIVILYVVGSRRSPSGSPYTTADEIGEALKKTENGYILDDEYYKVLEREKAWAILIDNETHTVIWNTDNLPDGIPLQYSLSDISDITLGYINDYPTYVGNADGGIVVLGYSTHRYWKSMWPTWDYNFIAKLPHTILIALLCNLFLIFLIYITVTSKLIQSVNPIIAGIKSLTTKDRLRLKEKGVFSEVAASINQAAELLQNQERLLAKKEAARANWIAGVSHDIRTPLSMIMGYADQLRVDTHLTEEEHQNAVVIVKQSERIRNLINDLNLASKLEYNMQPIHPKKENLIAIVRQVVVDFINMDIDDKHPIEWKTDEALALCPVNADRDLMKRAVSNLIQNSINHNEQGCKIYISVTAQNDQCTIMVADDGIGATDEQIEKLNKAPHYMVCDENVAEQRHGLGLLIVKQIMAAHGGTTTIEHSTYGGFSVKITLPII